MASVAFLENMQQTPIFAAEWKTDQNEATVPEDVSRIITGVLLFGQGTAWVDAAAFEITGEIKADPAEPARPLKPRGLTNLTALTRLYGHLRYFHPSDQGARADWDTIAIEGVRKIEGAANTAEPIDALRAIVQPVAPTVAIFATGSAPAADAEPDGAKFFRWAHTGVEGHQFAVSRLLPRPMARTSPFLRFLLGRIRDDDGMPRGLLFLTPLDHDVAAQRPNVPIPTSASIWLAISCS